jgi:penicillin-binding protein A
MEGNTSISLKAASDKPPFVCPDENGHVIRWRMRRSWLALGAVVLPLGLALVLVPAARSSLRSASAQGPIAKLSGPAAAAAASAPPPPTLSGLDPLKMKSLGDGSAMTAPLADKKTAKLTVVPTLQKTAETIMAGYKLPEAAVVLMDTQTGKILVYASHMEKGPARDLNVEATAPAASVFKVVTGSALVDAGVPITHQECFSGGEQRIHESDLVRDPKRDKWCATLSGAMGRSINTIFARLAMEKLQPKQLEETAKELGFASPLPFDLPMQPSKLEIPAEDQLAFARTAAGFWNTTLSPVHAAWLSATVARGGEPVRPVLVSDVLDEKNRVEWSAPSSGGSGLAQKRALKEDVAKQVATMMESTVSDGTSYKAFHDGHGKSFLPGVTVAGKTGTLTDGQAQRYYTWFTGFAPSKAYVPPDGMAVAIPKQVSIAVLIVNDATWSIKANVLAREVLRAYFAEQKIPMVTQPSTTPGTKHRRQRGS